MPSTPMALTAASPALVRPGPAPRRLAQRACSHRSSRIRPRNSGSSCPGPVARPQASTWPSGPSPTRTGTTPLATPPGPTCSRCGRRSSANLRSSARPRSSVAPRRRRSTSAATTPASPACSRARATCFRRLRSSPTSRSAGSCPPKPRRRSSTWTGAPGSRTCKSPHAKCERCWNLRPSVGQDVVHPTLCDRCVRVVKALGASAGS